jgi:hypothetical protein
MQGHRASGELPEAGEAWQVVGRLPSTIPSPAAASKTGGRTLEYRGAQVLTRYRIRAPLYTSWLSKKGHLAMTGAALDRVHFLDEQRRNRRRSLRFSVFAVAAVGLAGIPLCVLASPLLFGLVLVGTHVFDLIAPLSEAQWEHAPRTARGPHPTDGVG